MVHIPSRPWLQRSPPRRILAIRLQAMGDVVITLPYLKGLRDSLPSATRLDLLTRKETEGIPASIHLFDKVFALGGGRSYKKIMLHTLLMLPKLLMQRYDAVIDLQNNIYSDIVRRTLRPSAWTVYDRFSPISAAHRYQLTISALGLGHNHASHQLLLKDHALGLQLLYAKGWNGHDELVALNPAGAFPTRNWDIANYAAFARLWLRQRPNTRFIILGTSFIGEKAAALQHELGSYLFDLTGQTTAEEAFSILHHVKLMLSEDSGLMHMAWVSGVPTLALFGSTRSDWSRPIGAHTALLDSSDLTCGNCMQAACPRGDTYCLTRHTPHTMLLHALALIGASSDGDIAKNGSGSYAHHPR